MKKHTHRPFPWAAALIALFVASVCGALLLQRGDADGRVARIYQDGALIREIDLSAVTAPYEFTIETGAGRNTIAVRSGGIRVSAADCSDRICVNQGWLTGGAMPIVCLPHGLVIQLEAADPPDAPDAVSG